MNFIIVGNLSSLQLVYLSIGFVALLIAATFVLLRRYIPKVPRDKQGPTRVGIFHPYCNAGGGGERVLWCAVRALQHKFGDKVHIKIYTGDVSVTAEQILQNAKNVFNISVEASTVDFVFLSKRYWVEAARYPRFTLLGQSLGSIVLGMEALLKYQPDIFIDTMGYAFTYPLFRYLAGCKVASYTHYPIVNADMLRKVQSRKSAHNNQGLVASHPILTWLKIIYYRLFALVRAWKKTKGTFTPRHRTCP